MYSFYFSLRGNKNVPSWVVYTFLLYCGIAFLIYLFTDRAFGFYLFLSYPLLFYFVKQHMQIDFINNKYRLGTDIFGTTMGKWEDLPAVEYISVFAATYRNGLEGVDDRAFFKKLEINLVYARNKKLNVWVGDDKFKAIEAAKFIGENLNLRVLDATQREFIWLDK